MSNYLLYGEKLIENDSTMKSFANCICGRICLEQLGKENLKDEFMDLVITILEDDISRTDISYEDLMYKYRSELGDLLYEIENHGGDMPSIKFFGEEAKESFNYLIKEYIDIYFDEIIHC